jgi:1-acyl-sn-glycerol-3-phosphate acyltransferase
MYRFPKLISAIVPDPVNPLIMTRSIWLFFFRILGWKIVDPWPTEVPRAVIAVGPHTSSWDLLVAMAARSILRMKNARYLGKKELFDGAFGWLFRTTGGVPVDRSGQHNMVDQVVEIFAREKEFLLAMAPEGTRKRVDKLKTGFWHIAHSAGVPLILAGLDYGRREIKFSTPFMPTTLEADMKKVFAFFHDIQGKHPDHDMRHL